MANKFFIAEYEQLAPNVGGAPILQDPPLAEQVVTVGAEADSAVFGARTRCIRMVSDVACSYKIQPPGTEATATVNTSYLPANVIEVKAVTPGGEISVIAAG